MVPLLLPFSLGALGFNTEHDTSAKNLQTITVNDRKLKTQDHTIKDLSLHNFTPSDFLSQTDSLVMPDFHEIKMKSSCSSWRETHLLVVLKLALSFFHFVLYN